MAAGLLGLVGYNLPVTAGLRWLPAATAGLLLATEPVWVMVLGRLFLGERGGARAWLGSAVALAGVAVLAGPGAVGGARRLPRARGNRAGAGGDAVVRRLHDRAAPAQPGVRRRSRDRGLHRRGHGPLPRRRRDAARRRASRTSAPAVWAELAFLALGSTAAGLLLWSVAVLSGGITRVSLLLYLEPVVSVLGAAVFLGERVTPVMIGGGLLILAGVAASSMARPRRAHAPRLSQEDTADGRPALDRPGHRPAHCLTGGASPPGEA